MSRVLMSVTLLALLGGSASADVYKYTDEKGRIQYTDKPLTLPAERLNVQSRRTDTVEIAKREEEERKRSDSETKTRQQTQSQRQGQKETAELSAADKADRCAKARERFDKYTVSQRLFEMGENGERRYLSSDEIDAARASAKAAMDELCK
jgi:hypothetical protein